MDVTEPLKLIGAEKRSVGRLRKQIKINWDTSKPNGDMRRKMSTDIQEEYGLLPKLGFEEGIKETYKHYEKTR